MSTASQISRETLQTADTAARKLKEELLSRFLGYQSESTSFGSGGGAVHDGPAEFVDIIYQGPDSQSPGAIGFWPLWAVYMKEIGKDNTRGYSYITDLSFLIPWAELYPMFRNVFEPIGVPVKHPRANVKYDKPDPSIGDGKTKGDSSFTTSGLAVIVTEASPVYIQPIGDLTHSVWLNAELRLDTNRKSHVDKGLLPACIIDPFGIYYGDETQNAREYGEHICGREEGVDKMLTFYIRIPGGRHGIDTNIPIARLIAYEPITGAHTFELDQSVELLKPTP